MRILVVEDEFERAGLHVGHLRRLAFAADHAAATADAPISRRREDLREERAGGLVPLRDSGHVAAQSS